MIFSHLGAEIELRFIDSLTRDFILRQLETLDFGSDNFWWELRSQSNFYNQDWLLRWNPTPKNLPIIYENPSFYSISDDKLVNPTRIIGYNSG